MNKKIIYIKISTAIVVAIIVLITAIAFTGCLNANSYENPFDNIIRLHIRANSDELHCQNIKYGVRDSVLEFLELELADFTDHQAAKQHIRSNKSRIRAVSNDAIRQQGSIYIARIDFGVTHFPTITYASGTLQQGYYHALIIHIGIGAGSNWWCVIYPPLCFFSSDAYGGTGTIRYRSFFWDRITR